MAAAVTSEMARAVADAWARENPSFEAAGEAGAAVAGCAADGELLWYEVPFPNGACVIVAPDTEIEPVIAVIPEYSGEIPQAHPLRAFLETDMRRRLEVLGVRPVARKMLKAAVSASVASGRPEDVDRSADNAVRKWSKLAGADAPTPRKAMLRTALAKSAEPVTPATVVRYLPEWSSKRLTYWNQFSTYTPNNYPAGCVATAGAALLQFFNVTAAPKTTNECSVDGVSTNLTTMGVDYDWSILPEENAAYGSFTAAQRDVADRAVYDMGVCLGMAYADDGSGASITTLANVLRTKYGFVDARSVQAGSPDRYEKLIYAQIRAGAPVVLAIERANDSGHAVLAVGYGEDADATAYTRIFMGWGGSSDAWYALPNVNDYSMLSRVVTMIGTSSNTLAIYGRVSTESGKGAAYVDVSVGGRTVETDENGYWGARVEPFTGTRTCSCGGTEKTATAGPGVATNSPYGPKSLPDDLPGAVDFVVPDAAAFIVYSDPVAAQRAALREGKILMVLLGYDSCSGCLDLKSYLKSQGTGFTSDFVLFYANTQTTGDFGLSNGEGVPYWGTFDPRIWKLENRWAEDNGRFTVLCGYSEKSAEACLNSARSQWSGRNAAPVSLAVCAPDQITIPTALSAKLSFPDGTETTVRDGVTWSVVSGTAATVEGNDSLVPVAGASGNVTVRCEGYFWNAPYAATRTVRIIDGIVATGLEIDGPDVVDLFYVGGGQFTAQAVLADGSRVEVPVDWDVVEPNHTNCFMSASGYLSFKKTKYPEDSTVRVSARYGGKSAVKDVAVWGVSVKVLEYELPDRCVWPGRTVTLSINRVQWCRHGVWEEPTDDFTGVNLDWNWHVPVDNGYRILSGATVATNSVEVTVPSDADYSVDSIGLAFSTFGMDSGAWLAPTWVNPTPNLQYLSAPPAETATVTFYGNGGEPSEQTATYAVGRPYAGMPTASKTGYRCSWYTDAEGGTEVKNTSSCLSSVTRLYAHWGPEWYYVTYDANGGTGEMSSTWFCYDVPGKLPNKTFTKAGATFLGWARTPNGPVVFQNEAEILNLASKFEWIRLYAVWSSDYYTVALDPNGGTGSVATRKVAVGACVKLPNPFIRTGYIFAGWAESPEGAVKYPTGESVCGLATSADATVTLYAVWQPFTYTVQLDNLDGAARSSVTATYGSAMPAIAVPKRAGYTFGGYYTATQGRGVQYYTATGASARTWDRTSATTLYAKWSVATPDPAPVYYTVRFHANGGSVSPASRVVAANAAIGALPQPTRAGYRFDGWCTKPGAAVKVCVTERYIVASDLDLYAYWTEIEVVPPGGKTQPDPEPEVEPRPEVEDYALYTGVAGAAPAAASEYNGYLVDAHGNPKGTIQVKVGKANARTGLAAVKATVTGLSGKKSLKAAEKGKAVIAADGPTTLALVGGEACTVTFGAEGLSGTYGAFTIDGARNFFTSKNKAEQSAANALLAKWLGSVSLVWRAGSVNIVLSNKGKAKVSGTLSDGRTKVSVSTLLLVGEDWCCVPVTAPKAKLDFILWFSTDGRRTAVEGLGADAVVGKAGALKAGAKFRIDTTAASWAAIPGKVLTAQLPDGFAVTPAGGKWTFPKAGRVVYVRGTTEVDAAKLGANPSGLKLTYKAKGGTFKGSFKVYADNGGRLKATTVNVTGVLIDGVGHGTATCRRPAFTLPVTIR